MNAEASTEPDFIYSNDYERLPVAFDPSQGNAPFNDASYRINAELMKWLYEHLDEIIEDDRDQEQLFSNLGVDMAHITAAVNGVKESSRYGREDTGNLRGELLDYIICINYKCSTNATAIYRQDSGEVHSYGCAEHDAEEADYILVCREWDVNSGHGCKWFRISKNQLKKVLDGHENLIRH